MPPGVRTAIRRHVLARAPPWATGHIPFSGSKSDWHWQCPHLQGLQRNSCSPTPVIPKLAHAVHRLPRTSFGDLGTGRPGIPSFIREAKGPLGERPFCFLSIDFAAEDQGLGVLVNAEGGCGICSRLTTALEGAYTTFHRRALLTKPSCCNPLGSQ